MSLYDDEDGLRTNIAELQALVDRQTDLSPDIRVTGLAALVNAKATLRAIEAAGMHVRTIRDDVARPLREAFAGFPEAANGLAAGLRRLPPR